MTTDKQSENRPAHLWRPGQSGNPKGRPRKEVSLVSLIKAQLELIPDEEKQGRTNAELIAEELLKLARAGSLKAIKEVLDRVDGRPKQQVEIGNIDGNPFVSANADLSQLSTEDLAKMLEIASKVIPNADPDTTPDTEPTQP